MDIISPHIVENLAVAGDRHSLHACREAAQALRTVTRANAHSGRVDAALSANQVLGTMMRACALALQGADPAMVCPERRPPNTLLTKVLCTFGPDDEELDA